ncbi:glycine-rich domain-containing protein [Streptomyces sp. NPDC004393]
MSSVALAALGAAAPGPASAAPAAEVKAFATPGDHTFTVPQGVSRVRIEALGPGGGGGGGGGNANGPLTGGGGGAGGSGGLVTCSVAVSSGSVMSLTVGKGGAGGRRGGWRENGADGQYGPNSTVTLDGRTVAVAMHGWNGYGGEGSGLTSSGNGGKGSGPGIPRDNQCLVSCA